MAEDKKKQAKKKKDETEEPKAHKGFVVPAEDGKNGETEITVVAEDSKEEIQVEASDERFKLKPKTEAKKEKKLSDVKKSMEQELKKEKKVRMFHNMRSFFSGTMDDHGVNALKSMFIFSSMSNYLFNFFTLGVMAFLIIYTIQILLISPFQIMDAVRAGIGILLIVVATWIHEKIE